MTKTVIRGIVIEGKGEARSFTQLDWVRHQFREKLGFDPYPGTLNLKIETWGNPTTEFILTKEGLRTGLPNCLTDIWIEPPSQEFCAARCVRVRINGRVDAVWIIPEVAGYLQDQMELIAAVRLRDALGLKNGDRVNVSLRAFFAKQSPQAHGKPRLLRRRAKPPLRENHSPQPLHRPQGQV